MKGRLPRLSMRALYVLVAAAVFILFALGSFVVREYRQQQLDSVAEAASHYIRAVMKPLARDLQSGDEITLPASGLALLNADARAEFLLEKIWNAKGGLVLTSAPSAPDKGHRNDGLFRALTGDIAVELHEDATDADEEAAANPPLPTPYIEVYVPLFDDATRELIAVGEVYQEGADLLALRTRFERSIWSAVLLAIGGLLLLIGVSAVLNQRLATELVRMQALADQNRSLHQLAEQTRLDGARANEALLNRIGAEIHDGPVQILSLMLLKGAQPQAETDLTRKAVGELRAMASGLILPELHGLPLSDTIRLAAERHESLTGSSVAVELDPLPDRCGDELRICVYRVVQEGLSNAFRHAGGQGQAVAASVTSGVLHLSVQDRGATTAPANSARPASALGLLGMRHRLAPLGGTVRFMRPVTGGSELKISIPLNPAAPNA